MLVENIVPQMNLSRRNTMLVKNFYQYHFPTGNEGENTAYVFYQHPVLTGLSQKLRNGNRHSTVSASQRTPYRSSDGIADELD